MMILYLSSNVYMVGQKGMLWKYNFDLVPMRGEIATKQLGRLIRFLYPHFTFHISHFTFHISKPWRSYGAIWERFHEVSSGSCRCGAATPAAVYQGNGFLWSSATTKARGNLWFHNVFGKWRHVLLHSGRVSLWHPGDTWHIVYQGMSCTVHNVPCFSLVPWC